MDLPTKWYQSHPTKNQTSYVQHTNNVVEYECDYSKLQQREEHETVGLIPEGRKVVDEEAILREKEKLREEIEKERL